MNKQPAPYLELDATELCPSFRIFEGEQTSHFVAEATELLGLRIRRQKEYFRTFELRKGGRVRVAKGVLVEGHIRCQNGKFNGSIPEVRAEVLMENYFVDERVVTRISCSGCAEKKRFVREIECVLTGSDHGLPIQRRLALE